MNILLGLCAMALLFSNAESPSTRRHKAAMKRKNRKYYRWYD